MRITIRNGKASAELGTKRKDSQDPRAAHYDQGLHPSKVGRPWRATSRGILKLRSVGNPDFDQYFDEGILSPTQAVPVRTLREASEFARQYIEKYELGGGNVGHFLVTVDGKTVAEISYNGRVWKPRKKDGQWNDDEISGDALDKLLL